MLIICLNNRDRRKQGERDTRMKEKQIKGEKERRSIDSYFKFLRYFYLPEIFGKIAKAVSHLKNNHFL